jgi:general secretion pathway protein G
MPSLPAHASDRRSQNLLKRQDGMTLLEIMIVLAIVGGLIAVLGTQVNDYLKKSRVANAKILLKEIDKSLQSFNADCGAFPTTDQGLKALQTSPGAEVCPNWGPNAYWKKKDFKDPWNNGLVYESDGGSYVLKSLGEDRKADGSGFGADISSEDL